MRRYDDPVEVRRGPVAGGESDGPEQFLWRGRLWKVRAVLAHWVETGPWWHSAGVHAAVGTDQPDADGGPTGGGAGVGLAPAPGLLAERELWRVEAGRGSGRAGADSDGRGVFDLALDWTDGRWQLVGCAD